MELHLLLRGFLVGLAVAATFGPISLLCLRRTLSSGWLVGFLSGLGVATADATYGTLAAFGLSLVTAILVDQRALLQLLGGAFLVYLGVATLRSALPEQAPMVTSRGLVGAYFSTLGLTLTNPMTILSFVGIFAGLGLAQANADRAAAAQLVGGIFLGSACWWLILTSGVALVRERLSAPVLRTVNLGSGAAMIVFGLLAWITALAG